jgi:small subunit ribosomal protein S14
MKASIQKDYSRRILVKQEEIDRLLLKSMIINEELCPETKQESILDISELSRNSSPTRIQNRCILSGRRSSVMAKFKMSRIAFRERANNGLLAGVFKSSW